MKKILNVGLFLSLLTVVIGATDAWSATKTKKQSALRAGTMINAGWGTAIGGLVGAVGAGALGAVAGGKKEFCQEIESCEDINM